MKKITIGFVWLLLNCNEGFAEKIALACRISHTVGLHYSQGAWKPTVFKPGLYSSREKFILGIENDNITQESAKAIFRSSAADCKDRPDVGALFCVSPIGDVLYYHIQEKVGSISDISSVSDPKTSDEPSLNNVYVSIFSCQPF